MTTDRPTALPLQCRTHTLMATLGLALGNLVLPGCETAHPTSYTSPVADASRSAMRTVAVVPLGAAAAEFSPSAGVGAGRGAGQGAGVGAVGGAGAGIELSLATGPFAPVAAMILVPVMTVAGAVGGSVVGTLAAVPTQAAADAGTALAASSGSVSALLSRRIAESLPGAGKEAVDAASATADARLEVRVDRWGLLGGTGSDPPMVFFIEVSWQLTRGAAADGSGLERFVVEGVRRPVSEWTANDGKLLRQALDEALSRAAEDLIDRAFLIRRFHVPGFWSMEWFCGLEPLAPVAEGSVMPIPLTPPLADSLAPVLRWRPFPTAADRRDDTRGLLARVGRVRYDLRIWQAVADRPSLLDPGGPLLSNDLRFMFRLGQPTRAGELVYERRALDLSVVDPALAATAAPAAPPFVEHRVDSALAPGSVYMWTVRARFTLDGSEGVTPWSYYRNASVQPSSCTLEAPPPGNFYRFRTP